MLVLLSKMLYLELCKLLKMLLIIQKINSSKSKKTGLCGSIYDFVVDYEQIAGVKTIYDMHKYLMTKHNIKP